MTKTQKRIEALNELFMSELAYVEDLNIWERDFRREILSFPFLSLKLRYEICDIVFVNLHEIKKLHTDILNDMREKNIQVRRKMEKGYNKREDGFILDKNKHDNEHILSLEYATVYFKYITRFDIYEEYVKRLSKADFELERISHYSLEFREALHKFMAENNIEFLGTKHFIYRPSQKLARYPLLLKAVLKNTEVKTYEKYYVDLIEEMNHIAKKVDSVFAKYSTQFKIYRLDQRLKYREGVKTQICLGLFQKKRKLLREGELLVRTNVFFDPFIVMVYVFDHLILLCDIQQGEFDDHYILDEPIFLSKMVLFKENLGFYSENKNLSFFFPIYILDTSTNKLRCFYFEDEDSRNIYFSILKKAMKKTRKNFNDTINIRKLNIKLKSEINNACKSNKEVSEIPFKEEEDIESDDLENEDLEGEEDLEDEEEDDTHKKDEEEDDTHKKDEEEDDTQKVIKHTPTTEYLNTVISEEEIEDDSNSTMLEADENVGTSYNEQELKRAISEYSRAQVEENNNSAHWRSNLNNLGFGSNSKREEEDEEEDVVLSPEENENWLRRLCYSNDFFNRTFKYEIDEEAAQREEFKKKQESMILTSSNEGIVKIIGQERTLIYDSPVAKVLYDSNYQVIIFQSGSTLYTAHFNCEMDSFEKMPLKNDIGDFFYGNTKRGSYIASRNYGGGKSSLIYLFLIERVENTVSVDLSKKLYVGFRVYNIFFYKDKIVIACKDFEVVDMYTLRTEELLETYDPFIDIFFRTIPLSKARAVFPISQETYLLCFDSLGFIIDRMGRVVTTERIFLWNCLPVDFKVFNDYLVCLGKRCVDVYDLKTGSLIYTYLENNLKFVKGTEELLLHNDKDFYSMIL